MRVLVATSLALTACGSPPRVVAPAPAPDVAPSAPPSPPPSTSPEAITGEPLETAVDPAAFHVVPVDRATIDWEAFVRPMNARTDDLRVVYRAANGCFVLVVDGDQDTAPETVPCPETMRTAHWAHCPGGTMVADATLQRCLCHLDGSPPPPPHLQDCPPAPPVPEHERPVLAESDGGGGGGAPTDGEEP